MLERGGLGPRCFFLPKELSYSSAGSPPSSKALFPFLLPKTRPSPILAKEEEAPSPRLDVFSSL